MASLGKLFDKFISLQNAKLLNARPYDVVHVKEGMTCKTRLSHVMPDVTYCCSCSDQPGPALWTVGV